MNENKIILFGSNTTYEPDFACWGNIKKGILVEEFLDLFPEPEKEIKVCYQHGELCDFDLSFSVLGYAEYEQRGSLLGPCSREEYVEKLLRFIFKKIYDHQFFLFENEVLSNGLLF